jgi:hypothetical protein
MSGSSMHSMRSSHMAVITILLTYLRPSHRSKDTSEYDKDHWAPLARSLQQHDISQVANATIYIYIYTYVLYGMQRCLSGNTTPSTASTFKQHNALGQHADSATIIPSQMCLYPYIWKLEYQNDNKITNINRWITASLRPMDTLDAASIRIHMHGRLLTLRNNCQSDVFLRVTQRVSKYHNPVSLCIYNKYI